MTPEEIQELREDVVTEGLEAEGITSMSDGTRTVSRDPDLAKKRLDLLDRLESRSISSTHHGLRFDKFVPPGCG